MLMASSLVLHGLSFAQAGGASGGGFSVSQNGFPTYSYPLALPPGIAGLEPELSLNYTGNPTAGGSIGSGWSLKGLSVITRCQASKATDGRRVDFKYLPADKLCLDGNRLIQTDANGAVAGGSVPVQTNDSLGVDGGVREYRTEIDSYARIRAYGSAGGNSANGPAYFKVWTRDGRILEFGSNPNNNASAQIAVSAGNPVVMAWALSRISDLHGNYADFKYEVRDTAWGSGPAGAPNVGREWNLSEVQYTGNGAQAPTSKVVFEYADRPDYPYGSGKLQDRSETYRYGFKTVSIRLLQNIRTYVNSPNPASLGPAASAVLVATWHLGYDNGPNTNRSRLTSIRQCAGAAATACIQPVLFTYSAGGNDAYVAAPAYNLSSLLFDSMQAIPVDANGDGRMDLLIQAHGSTPTGLYLSNGDGSFTPASGYNMPAWPTEAAVDFNGDGFPDMLTGTVPNGQSITNTIYLNNGDGSYRKGASFTSPDLGLGSGRSPFSASGVVCSGAEAGSGVCYGWTKHGVRYFMDVDSDGLPDMVTSVVGANSAFPASFVQPGGTASATNLSYYQPYCLQPGWGCQTHVSHGNGDGSFTEIATNMAAWSMVLNPGIAKSMTGNGLTDLEGEAWFYPMHPNELPRFYRGAWLSQGDGNFLPALSPLVPQAESTLGCDSVSGSICFDSNGSGLQSAGMYGGTDSNVVYALNMGALDYSKTGALSVSQPVHIAAADWVSILPNPPKSNYYKSNYGLYPASIKGTGRDDLIRWGDDYTKNELFVARGDGDYQLSTTFTLNGQFMRSDGTASVMAGDFTGHGNVEFLVSNGFATPAQAYNAAEPPPLQLITAIKGDQTNIVSKLYVKADPSPPDQLQTITSSTGIVTRINYVPLGNSQGRYTPQMGSYPKAAMALPWQLVASVTEDTGVGSATATTQYSYAGLKGNLLGRGMLGFASMSQQGVGPDGSPITTQTWFAQDFPYVGSPSAVKTWAGTLADNPATPLSYVTNVYCDATSATGAAAQANMFAPCVPGLPVAQPYLYSAAETHADLDGKAQASVNRNFTVNNCGSHLTSTETLVSSGYVPQTLVTTTTDSFTADNTAGDTWLRCKLQKETVQHALPAGVPVIATTAGSSPYASNQAGAPNLINLAAAPASVSTNLADPGALSQNITLTPTGKFAAPLTYTVSKKSGATSLVTVTPGATTHIAASLANYGASLSETYTVKAADYLGRWGSVDIPVVFSISKKATTTTVSNAASATASQTVAVTATVAGASPTGTVSFRDASTGADLGTATLSNGSASVMSKVLTAGIHTFSAVYNSDGANNTSSSSSTINVGKINTTTSISPSTTLTELGWGITFTAHVNGYIPGQSVTFTDGGTGLATVGVDGNGNAAYSTGFNVAGNHTIGAAYSGDANNNPSNTAVTVGIFPPISLSLGGSFGSTTNASFYRAMPRGSTKCIQTFTVTSSATGGTGNYPGYSWQLDTSSPWVTMSQSGTSLTVSLSMPVRNVVTVGPVLIVTDAYGVQARLPMSIIFTCDLQGD